MKFILALSALGLSSLITVGCGQNHPINTAPPQSLTPTVSTPDLAEKDAVADIVGATTPVPVTIVPSNSKNQPTNSQANTQPNNQPNNQNDNQGVLPVIVNDGGSNPPSYVGSGTSAIEQQIGYQQNMLFQERAALDKAISERNNQVHLGPEFMDAAAYGLSSGFLSWDFLRRSGLIRGYVPRSLAPSPNDLGGLEGSSRSLSATAAQAVREAGPMALRATEVVSAAVLGLFFFGKSVTLSKDVVVRFSDTNDIRIHRAKVREAEKNLAMAKANLAAVYFPDKKINQMGR